MRLNIIRLKIANILRLLPRTERICNWLAPLRIGQDVDILNISKDVDLEIETNEKAKKIFKEEVLNQYLKEEDYKPYDEEEKEPPYKHIVVSPGFLGLGTIPISKDVCIKANVIKSHHMVEGFLPHADSRKIDRQKEEEE